MVSAPAEYPYSSYSHHALGKPDPLLSSHAAYPGLHRDPVARRRAYRALFRDVLNEELLTRLRDNTNACTVIGHDRFKEQIATTLGRAVP
jgi:putative transposase